MQLHKIDPSTCRTEGRALAKGTIQTRDLQDQWSLEVTAE